MLQLRLPSFFGQKAVILGVPADSFILNLAITMLVSVIIFLPALSSFGSYLFGTEDMNLFIWLFWHFSTSISSGANPFFAGEIFYPYGASLALTTVSPIQSLAYFLLPASWGAFGKITFLQVASFVLGGVFSFCLVYRFTKSFLPSLAGVWVFNFSVYHFETAIHYLNYSMALPFLALFFIFYFNAVEKDRKDRSLALLSVSLLLIALSEMTVAIMAGFIIFLDIFQRYLSLSGITLATRRNAIILAIAVIGSLFAHEFMAVASWPAILVYTLPSLIFIAGCILILGPENLMESEKKAGYLGSLALCSLPVLAYLAFLALLPSYPFKPDSVFVNAGRYAVPLEYLVVPSDFQALSHSGLFTALPAYGTEIYMGIASLALLAFSYLGSRASKEEAYFRNMSMLCLLFSFPIVAIGDTKLFATPFFVESLFPMLPVLRVPVRFMLFALLFLSVAVGLILKRLPETIGAAKGKAVVLVIALLLLAQQWPAMDRFVFNTPVPAFYASLATEPGRISIFLYPPLTYYDLLKEAYAQTIHQKPISSGVLSRPPLPYNPLLALYADAETGAPDPVEISDFVVEHGYDYVVVQKRRCTPFSFAGYSECVPLGGAYLKNATAELGSRFGEPVYEDGWIIVYRSR